MLRNQKTSIRHGVLLGALALLLCITTFSADDSVSSPEDQGVVSAGGLRLSAFMLNGRVALPRTRELAVTLTITNESAKPRTIISVAPLEQWTYRVVFIRSSGKVISGGPEVGREQGIRTRKPQSGLQSLPGGLTFNRAITIPPKGKHVEMLDLRPYLRHVTDPGQYYMIVIRMQRSHSRSDPIILSNPVCLHISVDAPDGDGR